MQRRSLRDTATLAKLQTQQNRSALAVPPSMPLATFAAAEAAGISALATAAATAKPAGVGSAVATVLGKKDDVDVDAIVAKMRVLLKENGDGSDAYSGGGDEATASSDDDNDDGDDSTTMSTGGRLVTAAEDDDLVLYQPPSSTSAPLMAKAKGLYTTAELRERHADLARTIDLACGQHQRRQAQPPAPSQPSPENRFELTPEPQMPPFSPFPGGDDAMEYTGMSLASADAPPSRALASVSKAILARLESDGEREFFVQMLRQGSLDAECEAVYHALNDPASDTQPLDGMLDRIRNAWRALRGKPPKDKKAKDAGGAGGEEGTSAAAPKSWADNYVLADRPAAAVAVGARASNDVPLDGFFSKLRGLGQRFFGIGGKPALLGSVDGLSNETARLFGKALLAKGKNGQATDALDDPLPGAHVDADKLDRQLISINVTKMQATAAGKAKSTKLFMDQRAKYNSLRFNTGVNNNFDSPPDDFRVVHVLMPHNAPRQITKADFFSSVGVSGADIGNEIRFDLGSGSGGFVNVLVDGQFTTSKLTDPSGTPMAAVWAGAVPGLKKVVFLIFDTAGAAAVNAPKSHRLHSIALLTLAPMAALAAAAAAGEHLARRLADMVSGRNGYTEAVVADAFQLLAKRAATGVARDATLVHASDALSAVLASPMALGGLDARTRETLRSAAVLADRDGTTGATAAPGSLTAQSPAGRLAAQLGLDLVAFAHAAQALGDPATAAGMLAADLEPALAQRPRVAVRYLGNLLHASDAILNGIVDSGDRLAAFWSAPTTSLALYAVNGGGSAM